MSASQQSAYLAHPRSPFAETVRSLRTNIMPFFREGKKSFLVTSSWRGEGKTTVVFNLGVALWEFGLKVLLVDGDLRQPELTRLMSLGASTDNLSPGSTYWPGLDGIAAPVDLASQPSDVLARAEFRGALLPWFEGYDCVLVDSPCLSLCSDALIMGTWVDGALMVVSRSHFRGIAEGNYSEDLRDQGIRLLGVVVTEAPAGGLPGPASKKQLNA